MDNRTKTPLSSPGLDRESGGKSIQRWSAARKREIVVRLLRGEPLDAISREIGVEVYRLERWRERALAGMDASLKERADDDPVQAGLDAAYKRVGGSAWRTSCYAPRSTAWRAGVLFAWRDRGDERHGLAEQRPTLWPAARLPIHRGGCRHIARSRRKGLSMRNWIGPCSPTSLRTGAQVIGRGIRRSSRVGHSRLQIAGATGTIDRHWATAAAAPPWDARKAASAGRGRASF
jgi:transposase